MDTEIKTLIIKKRGRKYFECVIGKHAAKLVINEISKDLSVDRVVKMEVRDLSVQSKFGVTLKFEAIAILDDRDAEKLREAAAARREADKWLTWAERDARNGMTRTNAITEALKLCPPHDLFAARLDDLKELIAGNAEASDARTLEQSRLKLQRSAERARRREQRVLYPIAAHPPLNTPLRRGERTLVFTDAGRRFHIDGDHPSVEGSHLLGHEGEWGAYFYYRLATKEEESRLDPDGA